MDRREFLRGAAAIIPVANMAQPSSLRDQVLGAWRIRDAETVHVTTGESRPWMGRPRPYSGIIVYVPNGFMSVQIGAARQPARAGAGIGSISADDKIGYVDTWYGYYGRFEVDERLALVRHFVEGSLFAFETGATLVRTISLENGVLTLGTMATGDTFNRLTWTRL